MKKFFLTAVAVSGTAFCSALCGQTGVALVQHAPVLNGVVDGSLQQMTAEPLSLQGDALVSGDLLFPGSPNVRLNGSPTLGSLLTGFGSAVPDEYDVTLGGNAAVGHIVTRTDPVSLSIIAAPEAPTGTRVVTLNSPNQTAGDFSMLRDLTLNGNAGQVSVPPGVYGDFTARGGSSFILGVPGASEAATYGFQHLALERGALRLAGPVILVLAEGISTHATIGAASNPEWLTLQIAAGGATLNGDGSIYGYVHAPAGAVTVNGTGQIVGGVTADQLTMGGGSLLRLVNLPPKVAIAAPKDGTVQTAPVASLTLSAVATDEDGYITKAEFFADSLRLGETTTAPYEFTWLDIPAGTHTITAKVSDNAGASTTSPPVTFIANAPPTVSLTAPAPNAVFATPGAFTLSATAADSDGTVAKVEFFQGATKLGESTAEPHQFNISGLASGSYTFTAKATDNYGASTVSITVTVIVEVPPTASVTAPGSVSKRSGVTLTASATDADGTVAKVEFYRDGELIGTVTSATGGSYTFTDNEKLAPGAYTYVVRSYDNLGLYTDSPPMMVTISEQFDFYGEKPVLKIVSGNNQARVSGFLPQPIVVAVYHADGTTPWPSAPVDLEVRYGSGGLASVSGGTVSRTLTITADANGLAQAYYWLP